MTCRPPLSLKDSLALLWLRGPTLKNSSSHWRGRLQRCVSSAQTVDRPSALDRLLSDRQWLIDQPNAPITVVNAAKIHSRGGSFKVLRDDLTHPFVGGNKRRKLDALIPELVAAGIKDVVTCGGSQSAHILAVAAACADNNMRAHLLIRGERPSVPTGNHLFARILAHSVVYVSRAEYVRRNEVLAEYAATLGREDGAGVAVISEGGADVAALLGMMRLVQWLHSSGVVRPGRRCALMVDSGTGTSAAGLALGAAMLDLPWTVVGIMLAGPIDYYEQQTEQLVRAFCAREGVPDAKAVSEATAKHLQWVPRAVPRKFGNVLPGEVSQCRDIATAHGVVVDPVWTLAAWQAAMAECTAQAAGCAEQRDVIMVHTGGALGLCGIAQRYPDEF